MKLVLNIYTQPQSFDAEDEIENALQEDGLFSDFAHAVALEIQRIMRWRDIRVVVRRGKEA